jgi:uncharacterized peroxidase-related enzyme
MSRDRERHARSIEVPIVDGLPDLPGIIVAMHLAPGLATHLRGLADALLVDEFPGATLTRAERELLAIAVSASNECYYCMDTHGAFASELLRRDGVGHVELLVDGIKDGQLEQLAPKMARLVSIARRVAHNARSLDRSEIDEAKKAGAGDGDIQLAVLIAAGFSMYNRMVDGLRAKTPATTSAYTARAREIADHGYSDPRTRSIPR